MESRCGDGYIDTFGGEECDLGRGCSATCHFLPCEPRACLFASRDPDGECVYTPANENSACEDGNACTAGDHCNDEGVCVGTAITQEASIRSSVSSFGAEPTNRNWMEGVASFVAADKVVFLDSNSLSHAQLTLAQVGATGLTRLSEATTAVPFAYDIRSVIYWGYEPTTFITPMNETRFAVAGSTSSRNGIEVFDLEGNAMRSRGYTPLPSRYAPRDQEQGILVRGAAARSDAMWLCGDGNLKRLLQAYAFDEPSGRFTKVAEISTPSGGCNELALSADGTRLFLAANGGYRIYDVSDPTVFAVPPAPERHVVLVPDRYVENLQVSDTYVALLTANTVGEIADIVVFDREGDMVATLPVPTNVRATPFGLALTGDRLYAQWADASRFFTSVHTLTETGMPSHAEFTFREGSGWIEAAMTPIARGDFVVLDPWRRVLHFDAGRGALDEITGPRHGSMRTILPGPGNEVVAIGRYSSHRVDLTDLDEPNVLAGGMNLPVSTADFQLAVSSPGARAQLIEPRAYAWDPIEQEHTHEGFSMFDTSVRPPATLGSGYVVRSMESTMIGFGGGALFQVTELGDERRVRRFVSENLVGLDDDEWVPDMEVSIPETTIPTHPTVLKGTIGVSASGADVLVVESRRSNEPGPSIAMMWLHVSGGTITKVAEGVFEQSSLPYAIDVAIVGDDAIILGNNAAARLHRTGSSIVVDYVRRYDSPTLYQRILHFDGERAMFTRHDWVGPEETWEHIYTVDVMDADDFTMLASYRTPDEVRSMLVVGTSLLFGMNTGLAIATPHCGP